MNVKRLCFIPALNNNIHRKWIDPTDVLINIGNDYVRLSPVTICQVKDKQPPQTTTKLDPSIRISMDHTKGIIATLAPVGKLIDLAYLQPPHVSYLINKRNAKLVHDDEQTELPTDHHYR